MAVSEQIINVLDALCEKFGIVIDWSQQNVLPYLQELMTRYIRYEIATSLVWCAIPIILGVALSRFSKKVTYKAAQKEWYPQEPWVWAAIGCWGALAIDILIGFLILCCQVFDIVKCLTIPELQIIAFLTSLSQ